MQSGGLWVWLSLCVTQRCCRTTGSCLNLSHSRLPRCGCSWKPSYPSCLEYGVGFLSNLAGKIGGGEVRGLLAAWEDQEWWRLIRSHVFQKDKAVLKGKTTPGQERTSPPTCLPPCHHLRASLAASRLGKQSLGEGWALSGLCTFCGSWYVFNLGMLVRHAKVSISSWKSEKTWVNVSNS